MKSFSIRLKCVVAALLGVVTGGTVSAATVYDAGEALMEALEKGATTGTFTDCKGGSWTFGDLGADDLNAVQAFGGVYREATGFNGFTPNGSLTVPFAIVNTTSEPLTHGGETGSNPLMPGEIVVHPNNPTSSTRQYVAIQFRPPRTGVYCVDAEVRDLSFVDAPAYTSDGVTLSIYARDAIQWSVPVGREKNIGVTNVSVSVGLYLSAGEPVTLIVDPNKTYNCDSTGVFLTLTEVSSGFGPLVRDVNAEILAAATAASPALPEGISCGYKTSAGAVTSYATPHEQANINCKGFATTSGFPWVMANTRNGISECDRSSIGLGYKLQPHELLTHPYTNEASFIQVAVPSAGVYRAVGVFRDVSRGGTETTAGILAAIRAPAALQMKALVSAERATGAQILEAPRLELAAGETVTFEVWNNGAYAFDSTGLQLFLFADEQPTGKDVINVDIDGKQPADPDPETYAGTARFAATGTKWNSLAGVENATSSVRKERLRTADGMRTAVAVQLEAASGSNLLFDNLANAPSLAYAGNSLLNDYLYTTLTPVTLTITGLVPGASYDLYLYTACGKTQPPVMSTADFGGVRRTWSSDAGKFFTGTLKNDHLVFIGLTADETGTIRGELCGGSVTTGSGVFNGFQLVGRFLEDFSGTMILVR